MFNFICLQEISQRLYDGSTERRRMNTSWRYVHFILNSIFARKFGVRNEKKKPESENRRLCLYFLWVRVLRTGLRFSKPARAQSEPPIIRRASRRRSRKEKKLLHLERNKPSRTTWAPHARGEYKWKITYFSACFHSPSSCILYDAMHAYTYCEL